MTVGWTTVAAVFLTLAGIYLVFAIRLRDEGSLAYLLFVMVAIGAAGMAASELQLANARSIDQYAGGLRFLHLPYALIVFSLPWFVYVLFHTGRRWLILLSHAFYAAVLAANFISPHSRLFGEITSIERHTFLGDEFSHALGTAHPGRWLGQIATILLLAFVADAALSLWKQGGRRRAIIVGGAVLGSAAFGVAHSALVSANVIHQPYMVSVGFLILLGGMAFELVDEALRAVTLAKQVRHQSDELQTQEERLRLAADSANLGLFSWSTGDQEIWITPRARRFLDLAPDLPVTWPFLLQRVHPDDRERVLRESESARQRNGDFSTEFRLVRHDDTTLWIATRGVSECTGPAGSLHVRGVVRNVTERRETRAALEEQRDEVAHLSRVTMMSEMSSSIAHELNQPLTAILSNAQAALRFMNRESPDLDEVRGALDAIVTEDRYASDVIERLRDFLKKGNRQTESVDVNELIEDVIRLAEIDLARQRVQVATELAPGLPAVPGDRVLLIQVLLNLMRNGADAMAEMRLGQRWLVVRTRARAGGIEITVTDRGPGIPLEDLERIFEPFYTTRPTGSGLGLAVSRTIMLMHGGEIWANPAPQGPGAAVHLFLPTERENDEN